LPSVFADNQCGHTFRSRALSWAVSGGAVSSPPCPPMDMETFAEIFTHIGSEFCSVVIALEKSTCQHLLLKHFLSPVKLSQCCALNSETYHLVFFIHTVWHLVSSVEKLCHVEDHQPFILIFTINPTSQLLIFVRNST
jgi:hypothetical protein